MNIPISVNPHAYNTREYFASLEGVKTPYTIWVTNKIKRLGLREGHDYSKVLGKSQSRGGQPPYTIFVTPRAMQMIHEEPRWQRR